MAFAPSTSQYLLKLSDQDNLPNSLVLQAGSGLSLSDDASHHYIIAPVDALASLAGLTDSGYLSYNSSNKTINPRVLSSIDGSLTITNANGVSGNSDFAINDNVSTQRVVIAQDGVAIATRHILNFSATDNLNLTIVDDGFNQRCDITLSGIDFADATAKYIIQTPNASLSNAQTLSTLATGIVKNTTTTGVLSIAIPNTDYWVPGYVIPVTSGGTGIATATAQGLLKGNGTSGFGVVTPGANGTFLTMASGLPAWVENTVALPATYILQTTDAFLPNAQVLGSLTTGIVKNTTTTGVLSIAVDGTDYYGPATTIDVAHGGTGLTTLTTHCVLLGADTAAVNPLTNGTTGQLLRAATGADPAWWTNSPTYIVQVADAANVPNAQALGALATGMVKNTTTTGVLSIGVEGTDYWAPGGTPVNVASGGTGLASVTANSLVLGAGTSALTVLANGTTGQYLRATTSSDPAWTTNTTKFIIQTADTDYGSAQVLGSLATGIVINTTTTGVLSIATEGTDYWKPGGTPVNVASGGTGLASVTANCLVLGAGTSALTIVANGTTGQLLRAATGADPAWWTNSPTYIVQTADATNVPNAQALGALATGIVKNTTTSGVLSIAAEGTDYWKPGGTSVNVNSGGTGLASWGVDTLLIGAIGGTVAQIAVGATNTVLKVTGGAQNVNWSTPYKSAGIATIGNAQSAVTVVTSTTGYTTIMLTKIQQGGGAMGATNKTLVANVDTITANDFRIFLDATASGNLDICWMIW